MAQARRSSSHRERRLSRIRRLRAILAGSIVSWLWTDGRLLYYGRNTHIFTVVSMYKALTALIVTLLVIGSAQAQRRTTESLLDNGQAASPGNIKAKPYDQNSAANPPDQNSAANPYSPDSINNPYRAGSQHRQDSPSHFGFRWAPDDE